MCILFGACNDVEHENLAHMLPTGPASGKAANPGADLSTALVKPIAASGSAAKAAATDLESVESQGLQRSKLQW